MHDLSYDFCIDYFARCPKLKSLTLDSFLNFNDDRYLVDQGYSGLTINKKSLEHLSEGCKELKDLKITNAFFDGFDCESKVKELFPNCNVELKKCGDDFNRYFHNGKVFKGYFWSHFDLRSLDNLEGGEIELMFTQNYELPLRSLDNLDGGEIELMFTQNYGEDIEDENGN